MQSKEYSVSSALQVTTSCEYGINNVRDGDTISYDASFIGIVKDITRRDTETGELLTVATTTQYLTASGTVPNLTVSPGKLHQR